MKAKKDIFSSVGKVKRKYCSKGDELKLVSDDIKVMIVEFKGDRFPINKEDVCMKQ